MPNDSFEPVRLGEDTHVFRSLKKAWINAEGRVQAFAFQLRREHPITKQPETGISVGIKGLETAEVFQGRQYNRAVGEICVGEICDVQQDLYVEQTSSNPPHAEIKEVPFWDDEGDEGFLIADDLADLTTVALPSKEGK